MVAFRVSFKKSIRAEIATAKTVYCYAFSTIIIIIVVIFARGRILVIIADKNEKFVGNFILLIQIALSALAISILGFFQVIHRNDYVRLINKLVDLNRSIKAQTTYEEEFIDRYCLRLYNIRLSVTLLQVSILLCPLVGDIVDGEEWKNVISFLFILYTHVTRTIFDFMIFGSMLVVLQLYRDINRRTEIIMDNLANVQTSTVGRNGRMQIYCDLSDGLDVMAGLYEQVTALVEDLVKFFGAQVIVELITAFANIIFGVRTIEILSIQTQINIIIIFFRLTIAIAK